MLLTYYLPFFIYTTLMKTVTLLGLITLLITILTVSELNGPLTIQQELASESVIEVESSENQFDCAAVFLTKELTLHSFEAKVLYCYKNDSILFDISKDLFRPPSLA